jgi:hypothetical protein
MNLAALIAHTRQRIDDVVEPYWVSDEVLVAAANTAQREACERALLLYDNATQALCAVPITAGQAKYTLHPSVITVLHARVVGQDHPLIKAMQDDLDHHVANWFEKSGTPRWYFQREQFLRLYPAPDTSGVLHLELYRYPLTDLLVAADEPELQEKDHVYLTHWMAYEAYSRADADQANPDAAKLELALFDRHFGSPRTAGEIRAWRELPRDTSVRIRPFA